MKLTKPTTKKPSVKKSSSLWSPEKFSRKWYLLAVVISAIAGYFIIASFAAPPPAPTIYLTPSAQTFAVNTTFTVQVRENSGSTGVNAVQANFSYPATLVDFVSISNTGTAFTTDAPSSGGSGQVSIARGIVGSLTGDQLIATVTFKTKVTGGTAAMAFTSGTALVSSSTNLNILPSLASTGGGSYIIDTTAPVATVTAPANGASISAGSSVTVTATATDSNSTVSSVDIYIDGVKATTLTTSPYNYTWNTSGVALANHTIQAKATDPTGNVGSSAIITVTVKDQTAPTVSITAPAGGAKLSGTVAVNSNAADNAGGSGISKVEFYVDGVLKLTDSVTPYNFSWDTTTVADGTRSLTVKAYDNASPANVTTSAAVSVSVDNVAPTTPGNFRTTGNTTTSIALAWNASTDTVGVTGYRITRNGATVTTTASGTLSYNDTGLASGTSYSYTVAALDAAGNASAPASLTASSVSAKLGDLNNDNQVNINDLSILLSNYATTNAVADINKDGAVNIFDLSILLSHYGT